MRGSRVQFLVAAPSAGNVVSYGFVNARHRRRRKPCVVDTVLDRVENRASLLGGVPERSKGSDCKSDGSAFVGSNPTPSTIPEQRDDVVRVVRPNRSVAARTVSADVRRMAPRVWFNGRTSAFQAEGAGSIPATRSIERLPSPNCHPLADGDLRKLNCSHSSVGRALPW